MRKNRRVPVLRLALAQVNTTVGDLAGNAAGVLERTREAAAAGADLVAFPELTITGYPPEDLVLRESFRSASRAALDRLAGDLAAAGLGDIAVVVGYVDTDGGPRNAAAFLLGGAVVARYYKHHLPNYGVFDERRYFVPGTNLVVVRYRGADIALTICEDVWQDGGPFAVAGAAGVGLVVNINGSPYERNKDDLRLPLLQRRAAEAGAPVLYVNLVGAQDELVFDGDSMVVAADGTVLLRAPQYVEGMYYADVARRRRPAAVPPDVVGAAMTVERIDTAVPAGRPARNAMPVVLADRLTDEAEVWGALVIGLRDYVPQERVPLRRPRRVRRHRLGRGRGHRGRRHRWRERARRLDAERVLLRALPVRRVRPRAADRRPLPRRADRADGRRVRLRRWC